MNSVSSNTFNITTVLWVLPEVCLELISVLHLKSVIKKSNKLIQKTATLYLVKEENYAVL